MITVLTMWWLALQSRSGCACAGPYGVSLMTPLVKSVIGITPEEAVLALEESPDNMWLKVRTPAHFCCIAATAVHSCTRQQSALFCDW
jgi:hypothetical protein